MLRIRRAERIDRLGLVTVGLDVPAGRLAADDLGHVLGHVLGRVRQRAAATRGDHARATVHIGGSATVANRSGFEDEVGRAGLTLGPGVALRTLSASGTLGTGNRTVRTVVAPGTLNALVTLGAIVALVTLHALDGSDEGVTVAIVASVEPDLIGIVALDTVVTFGTLRTRLTDVTLLALRATDAVALVTLVALERLDEVGELTVKQAGVLGLFVSRPAAGTVLTLLAGVTLGTLQ